MALLAEQIPEHHRGSGVIVVGDADFGGALAGPSGGVAALHRHAGDVALDVRKKHRDAFTAKALGERLQGDGLAGAGSAGDQPVAIGALEDQRLGSLLAFPDENAVRHVLWFPLLRSKG